MKVPEEVTKVLKALWRCGFFNQFKTHSKKL